MSLEPRALVQLGLAQLEAQRPAEAQSSLERALERSPNLPPALYYLTLAQLDQGAVAEAGESLRRLQYVSPDNQALPTLRALLCLKRQEVDRALLALELPPCPASPPWSRPELSSFGPLASRLALEVESWLQPLEVPTLQRSKALDEPPATEPTPEAPAGDRIRSSLFGTVLGFGAGFLMGLALRALLRLMVGPGLDFEVSWFELASLSGSAGGLLGALLGLWVPALPRRYQAYFKQLQGYRLLERALRCPSPLQRRQMFMSAILAMRRVIELEPTMLRSYYSLGEALLFTCSSLHDPELAQRFLPEAESCFLRSWEQDGENPYLNYYLGRCNQLQGKVEAAATYYDRAIAKFSKLSEGHFGLAQCHLLLGNEGEARRWMSRALGSELQLARDRLHDLGQAYSDGLLSPRPALPTLPPLPEPPAAEALAEAEDSPEDSEPVSGPEPTRQSEPLLVEETEGVEE